MDDNHDVTKKMYCLAIGKKIDKAMDSNRECVKISKALVQDLETLNECDNILCAPTIKHDRMISKKILL